MTVLFPFQSHAGNLCAQYTSLSALLGDRSWRVGLLLAKEIWLVALPGGLYRPV